MTEASVLLINQSEDRKEIFNTPDGSKTDILSHNEKGDSFD
jgi:hypothetical protein